MSRFMGAEEQTLRRLSMRCLPNGRRSKRSGRCDFVTFLEETPDSSKSCPPPAAARQEKPGSDGANLHRMTVRLEPDTWQEVVEEVYQRKRAGESHANAGSLVRDIVRRWALNRNASKLNPSIPQWSCPDLISPYSSNAYDMQKIARARQLYERRDGRALHKTSVYVSKELSARLANYCARNDETLSGVVVEAVNQFLDSED